VVKLIASLPSRKDRPVHVIVGRAGIGVVWTFCRKTESLLLARNQTFFTLNLVTYPGVLISP